MHRAGLRARPYRGYCSNGRGDSFRLHIAETNPDGITRIGPDHSDPVKRRSQRTLAFLGTTTTKVVPSASVEVTLTDPPCAKAIRRTI
jgi:hypothetical protein